MSHYYQKLSILEKPIYRSVLKGIERIEPEIKVLKSPIASLSKVVEAVLMDNPSIFYVKDYEFLSSGIKQYIKPKYLYSTADIIYLKKEVENITNTIIQRIKGNILQKILYIHDYICKNIKYLDVGYRTSHTCIGPVLKNEGVCEGFSKFFKLLCDNVGVDCVIVNGKAKAQFNNEHFENHAWNKVYINNSWFNIDATFDTTLSTADLIRHDYFLTSDEAIKGSHYESNPRLFATNSNEYDFYRDNNLLMLNQKKYIDFVKTKIKDNTYVFEIRIPSVSDVSVVESKILSNTISALREMHLSQNIEVSLNKDRLVAVVWIK